MSMLSSWLAKLPTSSDALTSVADTDAQPSVLTATATASGDSAGVSLKGGMVADETGVTSSVIAVAKAEADGTEALATGEAVTSGETLSSDLVVNAIAGDDHAETIVKAGSETDETSVKVEAGAVANGETAVATTDVSLEVGGSDQENMVAATATGEATAGADSTATASSDAVADIDCVNFPGETTTDVVPPTVISETALLVLWANPEDPTVVVDGVETIDVDLWTLDLDENDWQV